MRPALGMRLYHAERRVANRPASTRGLEQSHLRWGCGGGSAAPAILFLGVRGGKAAAHTQKLGFGATPQGLCTSPGIHAGATPSQTLPHPQGMGKPGFPYPCLRARPSHGQGRGETRFPHTPAPAASVHVRRSCAWRTTLRCTWPGSAGGPPAARLRGHGDGPLPDPPPLGAGTRLLPPAGGGWEGG